jgi:hypothetical protein
MASHPFPLARRMVIELLGPLMGARSKIQFQHLGTLEGFMFRVWRSQDLDRDPMQGLRASLLLLERAFDERPGIIAPLVYSTSDRLGPVQMEIFELERQARDGLEELPDARFRPLLGLYTALYERFYPLLAAPLVAADAVLRTGEDPVKLIAADGRVSAWTVGKMETAWDYPPGLITGGVDRHLRNSISHGRYNVLSRERIRMEDRDPKTGALTWGPHEFSYRDLRKIVFEFHLTCETLLATLVMFDVNNHEVIRERNFASPAEMRPRLDIIQSTMRAWAAGYGFRVEKMQESDAETLSMRLQVVGEREDHPADIFAGGPDWSRRYIENIHTEDVPISRQVYGLIQVTLDMHDTYRVLSVDVLKADGTSAGRLVVDRDARQHIFEGKQPLEQVRRVATEDTLIDETMPVILKDSPRPA